MNRPAHVSEWDNMLVADLNQVATDDVQLIRLNAVIAAAIGAQGAAHRGDLFASIAGLRLMKAVYALTECDGDLCNCNSLISNIAHECRVDPEDECPLDDQGEREAA